MCHPSLIFSGQFAVGKRQHSGILAEGVGKIAGLFIAYGLGNLAYREVRVHQQIFRLASRLFAMYSEMVDLYASLNVYFNFVTLIHAILAKVSRLKWAAK